VTLIIWKTINWRLTTLSVLSTEQSASGDSYCIAVSVRMEDTEHQIYTFCLIRLVQNVLYSPTFTQCFISTEPQRWHRKTNNYLFEQRVICLNKQLNTIFRCHLWGSVHFCVMLWNVLMKLYTIVWNKCSYRLVKLYFIRWNITQWYFLKIGNGITFWDTL